MSIVCTTSRPQATSKRVACTHRLHPDEDYRTRCNTALVKQAVGILTGLCTVDCKRVGPLSNGRVLSLAQVGITSQRNLADPDFEPEHTWTSISREMETLDVPWCDASRPPLMPHIHA